MSETSDDPASAAPIIKSRGQTPTEETLAQLCDRTFLKLWAYPNPFKSEGKELCDLIAVFDNHVFLFFDRESRRFDNVGADIETSWKRWARDVIEKQIATAAGAKRYILQNPEKVFLDAKCEARLPVKIPAAADIVVHKIVVAHGAMEACKNFSDQNITGSLGISYSDGKFPYDVPFMARLDRKEMVHLFDSQNLAIILEELDTFYDFVSYLTAKEDAVASFDMITYCGEEDVLAHYFSNFDEATGKNIIGPIDRTYNVVSIEEGEWARFSKSAPYIRKKEADKGSYLWDDLIQRTSQNALDGTLLGNSDIYNSRTGIFFMAKEPRFWRRSTSENIRRVIREFPYEIPGIVRKLSFFESFYSGTGYVFLQLHSPDGDPDGYEKYRKKRQGLLELACGVARNKFGEYERIIGIAIDAPKGKNINSEDFILMDCSSWTDDRRKTYDDANEGFDLFAEERMKRRSIRSANFPPPKPRENSKTGRNEKCPCDSGLKYKRCHGR